MARLVQYWGNIYGEKTSVFEGWKWEAYLKVLFNYHQFSWPFKMANLKMLVKLYQLLLEYTDLEYFQRQYQAIGFIWEIVKFEFEVGESFERDRIKYKGLLV